MKLSHGQATAFYKTGAWLRCRELALTRDLYLCQVCLPNKGPIHANTVHHVIHLKDDPSKALDLDNLISVCPSCHNTLHPEKRHGTKVKPISNKIKVFTVNSNPEIH